MEREWETEARNMKACWDAACNDIADLQAKLAAAEHIITGLSEQQSRDFQERDTLRARCEALEKAAGLVILEWGNRGEITSIHTWHQRVKPVMADLEKLLTPPTPRKEATE